MIFGNIELAIANACILAFSASLSVGVLLMRLRPRFASYMRDRNDAEAVQASHVGEPLRLGGFAVVLGLILGASLLAPHSPGNFSLLLLATLAPVFLAGLWEDLGHGVSAIGRFMASLIAACAAVALLGLWVPRGDLTVLDGIMGFVPAGVFFTVFLAALFCHAVNLIDGMNGLAASVIVLSSLGISMVAAQNDLGQIAVLSLLLAAATFGFQVLNWPFGKLFLGDAGAYGLGHFLVWLGISTIALAPEVAVPAVVLVLFYPFADTIHTVARRLLERKSIMKPDRMHLHQKIRRFVEVVWTGRHFRHVSNPLTTLILTPLTAGPVLAGVLLWTHPALAWAALAGFAIVFVALHVLITIMARRLRRPNASRLAMAGLEFPSTAIALRRITNDGQVSKFSRIMLIHDKVVHVVISRRHEADNWRLKIRVKGQKVVTWSKGFKNDREAWEILKSQIERHGIAGIVETDSTGLRAHDRHERILDKML